MGIGKVVLLSFFLFVLCGCVISGGDAAKLSGGDDLPQRYSLPNPETREFAPREGSIYQFENSMALYSDHRAARVGDLLVVKIVETSSAAKNSNTKTKRDSKLTGGLDSFFGLERWFGAHNSNFTPSSSNIAVKLKSDFISTGETTRDSTVTATMSARVTEVTLQGNLMIRGYREVRVNDETQHLIVSGLVRPEDVSYDNSILSSHIAEARIEYGGVGVLDDNQRPGWLLRGLDVIWPF